MQVILVLFSLISLTMSLRHPVRMFDFRNSGQKNNCTPYSCGATWGDLTEELSTRNISQITAVMLTEEPVGKFPEKVTICSTIYADFREFGDTYTLTRLPHWAFVAANGKPHLSLELYHYKEDQLNIDLGSNTFQGVNVKAALFGILQKNLSEPKQQRQLNLSLLHPTSPLHYRNSLCCCCQNPNPTSS